MTSNGILQFSNSMTNVFFPLCSSSYHRKERHLRFIASKQEVKAQRTISLSLCGAKASSVDIINSVGSHPETLGKCELCRQWHLKYIYFWHILKSLKLPANICICSTIWCSWAESFPTSCHWRKLPTKKERKKLRHEKGVIWAIMFSFLSASERDFWELDTVTKLVNNFFLFF